MRAIAKEPIFTATTTTYKGATLHHRCPVGEYDAHMATYAQGPTSYHPHLNLRLNVYNILIHNSTILSTIRTAQHDILFRYGDTI